MAFVGTDNPERIAGDDIFYPVEYQDQNGVGFDLTGATAKMDLRDPVTNAVIDQAMSGGIIDAANGAMLFTLTDVESAALLPRAETTRSFPFSVKITFADLTEQTILTGGFTFIQAATE